MYEPSKNTVYIAIAFTSIAALVGTCAYWDDITYAICDVVTPDKNNGEVRLVDDEGKSYTLINHGDGKETALYDDNDKSVTFHRDDKGNIIWDAGLASLIPTLAVGYYAFHGFSAPTARMDAPSMTYRVTSPLKPFDENTRTGSSNSVRVARTVNEFTRNRYNTEKSNRAHRIGEKYGFGSVGARTSGGAS
ncbi:hypothetical protein [Veillonella sp.]